MAYLATSWVSAQPRWMGQPNDSDSELVLLGRTVSYLRREAGISQEEAGKRYGTSGQNWGKFERGIASTIFQPNVQKRLAAALGADHETFLMIRAKLADRQETEVATAFKERGQFSHLLPKELTIRQRLMAAWSLDDDGMNYGKWPMLPDPRHPDADQWLAEIADDHADGLGLSRGDLVQCVAADQIGLYPRTGDLVIVERTRPVEERELTVRQVENGPTGVKLWARSSNPRLAAPLELPVTLEEAGDRPKILALVLSSVRRY